MWARSIKKERSSTSQTSPWLSIVVLVVRAKEGLTKKGFLGLNQRRSASETAPFRDHRAWQLLYLCCRTFPPSEALFPYIRVYIYQGKMGTLKETDAGVQVQATDALLRCVTNRGRKWPFGPTLVRLWTRVE